MPNRWLVGTTRWAICSGCRWLNPARRRGNSCSWRCIVAKSNLKKFAVPGGAAFFLLFATELVQGREAVPSVVVRGSAKISFLTKKCGGGQLCFRKQRPEPAPCRNRCRVREASACRFICLMWACRCLQQFALFFVLEAAFCLELFSAYLHRIKYSIPLRDVNIGRACQKAQQWGKNT